MQDYVKKIAAGCQASNIFGTAGGDLHCWFVFGFWA
jgi:hypothetical protein